MLYKLLLTDHTTRVSLARVDVDTSVFSLLLFLNFSAAEFYSSFLL